MKKHETASLSLSSFTFTITMQKMIGSLDINGGTERQKRAVIAEVAAQKQVDVLFLPADRTGWALWWSGPNFPSQ